MTEYVLHNRRGSGGFAVEAALAMAGADFRLADIDAPVSTPLPESFRAINPWKQVPVLDLPDGTRMTETAAMLIHIADAFPRAGIAPAPGSPDRAQFLRWTAFLATNVYESVLRRVYPDRYTDDPAGVEAVASAAVRRGMEALRVVEDAIGPHGVLLGERLSVADVYLAMLHRWVDKREALPRCTALRRRVAADEVVGPVWRRHFDWQG
ncbi:glutathione S-transferase family protein [Minwuia thermotolerans]|uniref:Glutathione S-transferase family protein n=1 Tax=Minwuia thermotolerans TaxID=2056226 RepID=A0A2M9FZM8_9PROT|nr:glutathione S-transferase family protein [Minwuia thermotolerans]PJK28916.1 glutathione S-transferase family protein [Minwuia thermotolerans]